MSEKDVEEVVALLKRDEAKLLPRQRMYRDDVIRWVKGEAAFLNVFGAEHILRPEPPPRLPEDEIHALLPPPKAPVAGAFAPRQAEPAHAVSSRESVGQLRFGDPIGKPLQHEGSVAAFEPKGERVVTVSEDRTARIWDAKTGEPIGKPLEHEGAVKSAAFDPNGERVVTASEDQTARIWDAKTGEPIGKPLEHEDTVNSAAFDPKGERVVTASEDETARIWDAKTGEPIGKPMQHEGEGQFRRLRPQGRARRHGLRGQNRPDLGRKDWRTNRKTDAA